MSASSLRSKSGYLELYKGGKVWKQYLFKVTGSTYFHYFGQNDAVKAKDEILLSKIKTVDLPAKIHKGGKLHVFEVKFSGKGSPWVLSASSQEEQMAWMDAVKPGSSALVTQFSQKEQLSPHPMTSGRVSPLPHTTARLEHSPSPQPGMWNASGYPTVSQPNQGVQSTPGYHQEIQATHVSPRGAQAMPIYHQGVQATHVNAQPGSSQGAQAMSGYSQEVQKMSEYSQGVQAMPGYSQEAQAMPGYPQEAQTMHMNTQGAQAAHMNSEGAQAMPGYPQGVQGNTSDEFQQPRSSNPYVVEPYLDPVMLNKSPVKQVQTGPRIHQSASVHGTSLSRRPHAGDPTSSLPVHGTDRERIGPVLRRSATEKFASNLDSNTRTPIVPPRPKETLPPELHDYTDMSGAQMLGKRDKPVPVKRESRGEYMLLQASEEEPQDREVVEFLTTRFTPDQLGMLRGMLEKMGVGEGSRLLESPETEKSFEYVVSKTAMTVSDTMLVTDEDDPDSYDPRPMWAKAVGDESVLNDLDEDLAEGLCSLEQEVCSIESGELSSMVKIGAGQFGEVFRAHYCPDGCVQDSVTVAVKKTKDDCPEMEKESLLQEMAIMSKMVHPNIVKLYGVVTQGVPAPWVVLEFLPYGDLRNYLVTHNTRSSEQLVKYMVDVAMGMHYLAERNLVHRDLAARNVLVGEGELCKVADFGLMRELAKDDSIYHSTSNTPCPIRWMAPECISQRQYSLASDVWAFGILQWEMYNPTKKMPYPGIDNIQVAVRVTKEGYRMPVPRGCPPVVARVMKACWHSDPRRRPSFRLITTLLTTKGLRSKLTSHRSSTSDPPEMYI